MPDVMLQLQLTPEAAIRGIQAPGAAAPVFAVHDFFDVVAQAVARNEQMRAIHVHGYHTPSKPLCPCGDIDTCQHRASELAVLANNRLWFETRHGFLYTMSSHDMLQRRGTWSKHVKIWAGHSSAPLRCWHRPTQNRMSVVPVMTVPELRSLLLRVDREVARTTLALDDVFADSNEFAGTALFNTRDARVRETADDTLARFINGDRSMLREVHVYSESPTVGAKRKSRPAPNKATPATTPAATALVPTHVPTHPPDLIALVNDTWHRLQRAHARRELTTPEWKRTCSDLSALYRDAIAARFRRE